MEKLQNIIKKLKNVPKIKYISIMILLIFAISISLPTLARYKNRLDLEAFFNNNEVWDGTVATGYQQGNGEETNPYIISNAKEFAFFREQLQSTNYEGKYFKLASDILINKGTFNYENSQITYTIDNKTMYMKNYTNELYETSDLSGEAISTLNSFNSLNNFAGHLDGDHYRIYGLYMTSENEELGLFTNLQGTIENLYIENALVYGGAATAILASTANNATITNVYTSGNVVGTANNTENTKIYKLDDYEESKGKTAFTDTLTLPTTDIERIKAIHLKGTYYSNKNRSMKINDVKVTSGEFDLELGTEPLTELTLSINDNMSSEFSLTNMTYEIIYEVGITSGIVAKTNNTTIKNVINKANVYGQDKASGLLGITSGTNIQNAYNIASINAINTVSGLIDSVVNSTSDVTINRLYNTGSLNATNTYSFLNAIDNSQVVQISNTFNTAVSNANLISDQELTLTNVLDVNSTQTQGITTIAIDTVKEPTYLKETLGYKEFVDNTVLEINEDAVWVYETSYLPILYIDDLNDPIATLNVGTYTWEGIGYELKDVYLSSKTAFKITPKDQEETISAYYYIHNEKSELTKTQLDNVNWQEYSEIVTLNEEGYYVIYVKVTDSDNNTKYISSEQLILDLNAPSATITMNDNKWTTFTEDLTNINIADTTDITLVATDTYSEVKDTKYYVSNILLTEAELKELDDSKWSDYQDKITLTEKGTYVVNVKVTDAQKHTAYYNTDYIVFGGFEETLTISNDTTQYDKLNITNKSSVTYNFIYNDQTTYQEGYTTNLITSIALPINTKLTLINNNTKEVYKYKVTEEKTLYNFKDFTKVGKNTNQETFSDQNFINEDTKNVSLTIDFKEASPETTIEFTTYIDIFDASDKTILSTLRSTLKPTKVIGGNKSSIRLETNSEISTINLVSDTITNVDLKTSLYNMILTNEPIYNNQYKNQKLALAVKLVNSQDEVVAKRYLKNIEFKLGTETYTPDNDGIVRIKLSDKVETVQNTLKIITYSTDSKLETGDYNFVITPYVTSDGKYSNNFEATPIKIPATTTKKEKVDYGLNITMDQQDKVLYKKNDTSTMNFKISETSNFTSSNIRISLYKKQDFSAYNQTYEIIDLKDYVLDELTKVEDNIYYVTTDELALSLNTTLFDKTGYEIRFDLYDGDTHITTIKKKFIVR